MLEVEIQKLTAAITALTEELRSAKVGNELPTQKETPTNLDKLQQDDRSYREDNAVREAMQKQRDDYVTRTADLHDERDQKLANLYKTEQAKAKRKAKVTKEEAEALVEAAVPLVSVAEALSAVAHLIPDDKSEAVSAITAEDLKTVAMEIARADSSARPLILSILSEHGAKTITQLDPKHYQEVHGRLMSIAYDIAKNGEVTQ